MPKGDKRGGYPTNRFIEKLRELAGEGPLPSTVRLAGYLGGSAGGKVRLHVSLEDPEEYLEVAEEDVLFSDDAHGELPGGGTYLWVKPEAKIRCVRFQAGEVEARYLAGPIAEAHLAAGAYTRGMLPPTVNEPPTTRSCAAMPIPTRWCLPWPTIWCGPYITRACWFPPTRGCPGDG